MYKFIRNIQLLIRLQTTSIAYFEYFINFHDIPQNGFHGFLKENLWHKHKNYKTITNVV